MSNVAFNWSVSYVLRLIRISRAHRLIPSNDLVNKCNLWFDNFSDYGRQPDISLMWEKRGVQVACKLSKDQVCAKYTTIYNGLGKYTAKIEEGKWDFLPVIILTGWLQSFFHSCQCDEVLHKDPRGRRKSYDFRMYVGKKRAVHSGSVRMQKWSRSAWCVQWDDWTHSLSCHNRTVAFCRLVAIQ